MKTSKRNKKKVLCVSRLRVISRFFLDLESEIFSCSFNATGDFLFACGQAV